MKSVMRRLKRLRQSLALWWDYNMDAHNCCGLRRKAGDWWHERAVAWLTPWLRNTRRFLDFCIQENGTKLLDSDAMSFYIRSRDQHQYYFTGEASLSGLVRIWRSQWRDPDGTPVNLFMRGIARELAKEEEMPPRPVEDRRLVFSGRILTRRQLRLAKERIVGQPEFGWDWLGVSLDRLADEVGPRDRWRFRKILKDSVLNRLFPGVEYCCDLEEEDYRTFEKAFREMSADEARRIWETEGSDSQKASSESL